MAVKHPEIRVALGAATDDFRIIDHVGWFRGYALIAGCFRHALMPAAGQ